MAQRPPNGTEAARFRSFAERYVAARAALFSVENEREDAWKCILNAKSVYKQISAVSGEFEPESGVPHA